MKIIFFLFLISFFTFYNSAKSDSSKIYNKGYKNPLNVLGSFLWNGKKEGKIGLISKVNVQNRNLEATVHPVSIDPSKIKIALSKVKYIDEEKEFTDFIFNEKNLELLSIYASKGLLLANNNQDVIFQFINKKKEKNVTQGIIFAQKNSLNLVFFQIHGCGYDKLKNKRIKKKEFYKNHPNFSFVKKKNCHEEKKKISVTSTKGIYKKSTNENYSWIIFTSASWKTNTIN